MADSFRPDVGRQVRKSDAEQWISEYQKLNAADTRSVFYGRQVIQRILADPSISGIRFVFCRKTGSDGVAHNDIILVGSKDDGSLVWSSNDPSDSGMLFVKKTSITTTS